MLPGGLGKMMIMLPVIFLMKEINFEEGNNVLYLRIAFGTVQSILLLACLYIFAQIRRQNNQRKITVPPPEVPSWAGAQEPQAPQVMTIREYDQTELRKYVTQNLMVIAICTFIHIKWAICPPLFIQCFVMPQSFYENPIFKLYILGQDVTRPFKQPSSNPFASLMQNDQAADNKENKTEQEDAGDQDNKKKDKKSKDAKKRKVKTAKAD